MSSTETNRAALQDLLNAIATGRLMEGFEKHYHEDVFMSENGADEPNRHGKDNNRQYEQYFVDHATFHDARLGAVIADGDITAYEMWMDLTFDGHRMQRHQAAIQTWKDGQIIKEVFYYNG